jgi:quinolinate synthase
VPHEVVELADEVGSTEKIIKTIAAAPAGTAWVVGTELNLVKRLATSSPSSQIAFLEKNVCYCSTMNRIDLPHLVWALESLVEGRSSTPSGSTPRSPTGPGWRSTRCSPCPAPPTRD